MWLALSRNKQVSTFYVGYTFWYKLGVMNGSGGDRISMSMLLQPRETYKLPLPTWYNIKRSEQTFMKWFGQKDEAGNGAFFPPYL